MKLYTYPHMNISIRLVKKRFPKNWSFQNVIIHFLLSYSNALCTTSAPFHGEFLSILEIWSFWAELSLRYGTLCVHFRHLLSKKFGKYWANKTRGKNLSTLKFNPSTLTAKCTFKHKRQTATAHSCGLPPNRFSAFPIGRFTHQRAEWTVQWGNH